MKNQLEIALKKKKKKLFTKKYRKSFKYGKVVGRIHFGERHLSDRAEIFKRNLQNNVAPYQ